MSYLDRLKRKILEKAPECEATKGTKAPYVPFVAPMSPPSRQISQLATVMEFGGEPPGCQSAEVRRQRVLAMLEEHPGIRYAVLVGSPADDTVLLTLAVRGEATSELAIEAARFDPFELISMLDRHGQTVH